MRRMKLKCTSCFGVVELPIPKHEYEYWKENKQDLPLIQDLYPAMTDDEREIMLSGICGICYDKLFDDEKYGEQ